MRCFYDKIVCVDAENKGKWSIPARLVNSYCNVFVVEMKRMTINQSMLKTGMHTVKFIFFPHDFWTFECKRKIKYGEFAEIVGYASSLNEALPHVALAVLTHIVPSYPFYIYSFKSVFLLFACTVALTAYIQRQLIQYACIPILWWLNYDEDEDDDDDNDKVDGVAMVVVLKLW